MGRDFINTPTQMRIKNVAGHIDKTDTTINNMF